MVRPLSFRRSSGGPSSSSAAPFAVSTLPSALPDDILFEDVAHHLHQISKIKPLPIEGRTPCKKDALRSRTHGHLARLFALIPSSSPSRTELGNILFGFLFPHMDVHRRYDMKEGKLGRTLARVLNVEVGQDENGGWREGEALMRWDDASFWGEEGEERGNWDGSMGQVVARLQKERSEDLSRRSTLTISQVDHLLNELASHSSWSSSSIRHRFPRESRRSMHTLLAFLYSSLSPIASSLLTQLLLRDITPFLHPPPTTLAMTSLLKYDQASICKLTHWDVMDLWDPTGALRKAHRLRGNFADALDAVQRRERALKVGVNIEIPKCQKGRALRSSLLGFQKAGSRAAWAETKYDGERMQIHVDFSLPPGQQIKIFSKSKRDSTTDRRSTHASVFWAILAALSRPVDGCTVNSHLRLRLDTSTVHQAERRVSKTVILEAEMVPYSERKSKIEEFWKITACAGDRRAVFHRPCADDSQEAHPDDLHLMLVFFDVLEFDGDELLYRPYALRRKTLESIIRTIPGFTMLAERHEIRLSLGLQIAEQDLQVAFAQSLSAHEEGLVLKAVESKYNCSPAWLKLKRDYIPGLDDTIDLVVVGASWDKERGRELNVSPSVFTTFYLGVREDRPGSGSPHFLVLFSVSYGLDRKQLEDWTCRLQMGDSPKFVPYKSRAAMETLSYSFELVPSLKPPPMVMLKRPLLAEVFGAGFQKLPSCKHFALRWPRLSKICPASGNGSKKWTEGLTSSAYRKLALADLGRTDEPETRESSFPSLDWDTLFTPLPASQTASLSQTFWQGKLREESVRESQEEARTSTRPDATPTRSPASKRTLAGDRRPTEDQDENSSPCKRQKILGVPSSSPSPAEGRSQTQRSPITLVRPKMRALGSASNVIAARDACALPTPPPTSPDAPAKCILRSALEVPTAQTATSRSPNKRVHPDDSGVCLSPTASSTALPPSSDALGQSHDKLDDTSTVRRPETLAGLLLNSLIFLPPGLGTVRSSPRRTPSLCVTARLAELLPEGKGIEPWELMEAPVPPGERRVVLVDPDRVRETQQVLETAEGETGVVVLNVWCLRARTRVRQEDWRRWVVNG